MTDGSSQGLFVVVAVVIFGIFVSISYLLFRDQLTPSLASIFSDTVSKTQERIIPFDELKKITESKTITGKIEIISSDASKVFEFNFDPNSFSHLPSLHYIGVSTNDLIEIPWNHKIIFSYDILHNGEGDVKTAFDFNSYPSGGILTAWDGNDNYGDFNINRKPDYLTKPNVWTTVEGEYSNNSTDNTLQVSLFEGKHSGIHGTVMGVFRNDAVKYNVTNVKIKNIQYKVVPI